VVHRPHLHAVPARGDHEQGLLRHGRGRGARLSDPADPLGHRKGGALRGAVLRPAVAPDPARNDPARPVRGGTDPHRRPDAPDDSRGGDGLVGRLHSRRPRTTPPGRTCIS
jgi:hypothetical protein